MDYQKIAEWIINQREYGLSDQAISDKVRAVFSELTFDFGFCSDVDSLLGKDKRGGYWRESYGWPKVGAVCKVPLVNGTRQNETVTSVGFFTFTIE